MKYNMKCNKDKSEDEKSSIIPMQIYSKAIGINTCNLQTSQCITKFPLPLHIMSDVYNKHQEQGLDR